MSTVTLSLICVLIAANLMITCMAGAPAQRYCGRKLTDKVRKVCNNCIHGEGSVGILKRHTYEVEVGRRRRRAVNALIPVCCINPCTEEVMEEYCCNEDERLQYEEGKKFFAA
ncbi:hypothetical protein M3Y97_01083100 [Aphelenchoides bicaudatus]|nr:hypothetical protein M3Y97_01083100 [Aphelenchoides bicaudatus]